VEQSDQAADLLLVIFGVTRTGTSCPALDASLQERWCQNEKREEKTGIHLQKGRLC